METNVTIWPIIVPTCKESQSAGAWGACYALSLERLHGVTSPLQCQRFVRRSCDRFIQDLPRRWPEAVAGSGIKGSTSSFDRTQSDCDSAHG